MLLQQLSAQPQAVALNSTLTSLQRAYLVERNTAQRKVWLQRTRQRSHWQLLQLQKLLPNSQIPTEGFRDSRDLDQVIAATRSEVSSASAEVKSMYEHVMDALTECLVQELCAVGSASSYWTFPRAYLNGKAQHVQWLGRISHMQSVLETGRKVDPAKSQSFDPAAADSLPVAANTRYEAISSARDVGS